MRDAEQLSGFKSPLLGAAQVEGTLAVAERIDEICKKYDFAGFFQTSARRGDGVEELTQVIRQAVRWDRCLQSIQPRSRRQK